MKNLKFGFKSKKGITLIALIITIIVLLILAGVTIAQLTGDDILNKAQTASDETTKSQAAEAMNLKITNIQISSYAETQTLPNLQYLADKLCEDNDMEYVLLKDKKSATLTKITVSENDSILTKLKEYPYEFEINSSLQLASIDGVRIESSKDINNAILNESSIINDLKIKAEEKAKKITIDLDEEVEIDKNLIKGYIIALNNKTYDICKALPYTTSLLEAETDYDVKVIVIDEDIKCKISNTIAIKTSALEEVDFIKEYSLGKGNVSVIDTYSGRANYMVDSNKNTVWRGNGGAYGTLDFGYEIIPTEFYICIPLRNKSI